MTLPQFFSLYVAVGGGLVFAGVVLAHSRHMPNLVDVFQVVLAIAAISAGVSLCAKALDITTQLGDLADDRLTILLGGFAVAWVALTTIVDVTRKAIRNQSVGVTDDD